MRRPNASDEPAKDSISALAAATGWGRRTIAGILSTENPPVSLKVFCGKLKAYFVGGVETQRERRARVSADLLCLELLERTHATVPIEWWKFSMESVLVAAQGQLLYLGQKIASVRRDPTLAEAIDKEVRAILSALSDGGLLHPETPKKLQRDWEQFIDDLVKTSPTAKQFLEIRSAIEKEFPDHKYDDEPSGPNEDREAPVGESEAGACEADTEPAAASEAPGFDGGGPPPDGDSANPGEHLAGRA